MSRKFWLLFLRGTVASTFLAVGFVAQAALWAADYDPPAYVGTATFEVPTACLSGVPDGPYVQGDNANCSPIQIMSNVSIIPAVDFASILPQNLCAFCEYEVIGEQFVGVNTGIIGSVFANDSEYWFEFLSTYSPGDGPNSPPSVTNFVNLYDDCMYNADDNLTCGDPIYLADIVVFAAVPEPGSMGLILSALGAGWLARRRKAVA